VQSLTEHLDIDPDRANRIILQLRDSQAIFKVEVEELHDRPTIELKDGLDYKDSTALSHWPEMHHYPAHPPAGKREPLAD